MMMMKKKKRVGDEKKKRKRTNTFIGRRKVCKIDSRDDKKTS
jgi:hypothetical protein